MDQEIPTPLQILQRARDYLSEAKRWCKRAWARDQRGLIVDNKDLDDPLVCQRCIEGALGAAAGIGNPNRPADRREEDEEGRMIAFIDAKVLINEARIGLFPARTKLIMLPSFNDDPDTTHSDVLGALDAAIALGKQRETVPA